jgi:hypothetical protein
MSSRYRIGNPNCLAFVMVFRADQESSPAKICSVFDAVGARHDQTCRARRHDSARCFRTARASLTAVATGRDFPANPLVA